MCRPKRRTDEDFSREVQAHLALETDRLIADGWEPKDARDAARRAIRQRARGARAVSRIDAVGVAGAAGQDVRYAWRGLVANPAFAATAIVTLAVGLGLVTVVFAIFNAYVLRPFAVRDPYSAAPVVWRSQDDAGGGFRWRDYQEMRGRTICSTTRLPRRRGWSRRRGIRSRRASSRATTSSPRRAHPAGRPLARFDAGDRAAPRSRCSPTKAGAGSSTAIRRR